MKKKYTAKQLKQLEKEMKDDAQWEEADHTINFNGPTSVRFPEDILRKMHAVAKARKKPINRLVNEWVKPFVEGEYALLQSIK
ncbi:hypothetical protein K1X76_03025 [bacterium]|nr:hypothetical protein [bacterium]